MENSELKVIVEAVRWWKGKRPLEFNQNHHLENPHVNCTNDKEIRLAIAVSKLLKLKSTP